MKKSTTKSIKSPAPATKPTSATKPPLSAKATGKTTPPISTPLPAKVKPVAPTRVATKITALIDIGFGNTLFIRGDGPGLSWEKGLPLESAGDDKWRISLGESAQPVIFKFLVNDTSWSAGEDYSVAPGTSIAITPVF